MAHYYSINAVQTGFVDVGTDAGYSLLSCNFNLNTANGTSFESDFVIILDQYVPTLIPSENLFIGSAADFSSLTEPQDGPYVCIFNTGGQGQEVNHDNSRVGRPSIQVLIYCKDRLAGGMLGEEIFEALEGKYNITL